MRDYREHGKNVRGVSPLTAKRELAIASAACNYAISEWDYGIPNPFEKRLISKKDAAATKHLKKKKRIVTPQEEIRLRTACVPIAQDILTFAINTGLRLGEIADLRWDQIGLDGGRILFKPEEQKNGKYGERGLNTKAKEVVERQPKIRDGLKYVFTINGRKIKGRRITKMFMDARIATGLTDIKFKDLRKTCGQRIKNIAGIEAAKMQLGHSTVRTTEEAYVDDDIEVIREALEAI